MSRHWALLAAMGLALAGCGAPDAPVAHRDVRDSGPPIQPAISGSMQYSGNAPPCSDGRERVLLVYHDCEWQQVEPGTLAPNACEVCEPQVEGMVDGVGGQLEFCYEEPPQPVEYWCPRALEALE